MAKVKITKSQAKRAVKAVKKMSPAHIFLAVIILIVAVGGYFAYTKFFKDKYIAPTGELEFHFMELGNASAGDCVYIKAGDNDILIDGGSTTGSLGTIVEYLNTKMTDKTFEYVIVTHGHEDHIACFAGSENGDSLFDLYEVEVLIDFPKTNNKSKTLDRYYSERQAEIDDGNTVYYTALQCYNGQDGAKRFYNLSDDGNIKFEILYNYFYDHVAGDENDNSVCVQFHHGSRKFLFTGDLEHEGEEKLAEFYDFSQVELFKAGHHGSPTSSTEVLLQEIKPKICVACCCAGSVEYTDYLPNTFPSQAFYQRVSAYTDKIYVPSTVNRVVNTKDPTTTHQITNGKEITITNYSNGTELKSLHGNITVISSSTQDEPIVNCTGEKVVLKDTAWFKEMSALWEVYEKMKDDA